jgi:hypothetical protein
MPVIPDTWEMEAGGSQFETNLSKVSETLCQKLKVKLKGWGHGSNGGALTKHAQGPGFNSKYSKKDLY